MPWGAGLHLVQCASSGHPGIQRLGPALGIQVSSVWAQLWGMAGARRGSWGRAGKPLSSVATLGCTRPRPP